MGLNRAMALSAVDAAAGGALSLVATVAIARLAGPAEVGLAAAAIAPNVVLWVIANSLFADALVQRMEHDPAVLDTLAWSGLALGLCTAMVQAAMGPALATVLDDPRLGWMAVALAAPLPWVGMAGIAQGILTRDGRYGALALRTVLGQGAGVACGVAMAGVGGGAWALVMQQAVGVGMGALVLLGSAGWRPRLRWQWALLRPVLATALPLTGATLTQIARYRVFAVLLGSLADPAVLGQTHMAFRLVDAGRDLLFTALWRLYLPPLARTRDDAAARLALVDRLGAVSSRMVLPACGAGALAMPPVMMAVLGPAWGQAAMAALPLLWLTAALAVLFPSGVALVAAGGSRFALYGNLATGALTVALVAVLRPADARSAAWCWVGADAVVLPWILWVHARALGVGPLRPVASAAGGLALVGVAALAAAPWIRP